MSERPTRVLIIEDDPTIVDLIRANLAIRGYEVSVCSDVARASWVFETESPDLVLLDLNLPDGDGIELCRELRGRSDVGMIVVSARRGEHDKVRALNLGADDYMTKPFGIEELMARIVATLRRTRPVPVPAEAPAAVRTGSVEIDVPARRVTLGGALVHLTPTEFALLAELAASPGALFTHAHLLRKVWGMGYETETEYVRVYVKRLRAKLEPPGAPPVIITEPRVGYRLATD
ncbi:MAG: response regulator transcription factor [Acidimicrobiales bacterium]